ncbi:hypothetical protein BU16DRAFT_535521 [Lophium mytilinum]|uniref:Uncharacterized protein n=1 Tax=Lophium mytilinum TaxID=390894 RepID=A0A6A6R3P9_9PEZI|nr:hypothetical protein BU16DRAFT_535521 [Lophium mytilinum]
MTSCLPPTSGVCGLAQGGHLASSLPSPVPSRGLFPGPGNFSALHCCSPERLVTRRVAAIAQAQQNNHLREAAEGSRSVSPPLLFTSYWTSEPQRPKIALIAQTPPSLQQLPNYNPLYSHTSRKSTFCLSQCPAVAMMLHAPRLQRATTTTIATSPANLHRKTTGTMRMHRAIPHNKTTPTRAMSPRKLISIIVFAIGTAANEADKSLNGVKIDNCPMKIEMWLIRKLDDETARPHERDLPVAGPGGQVELQLDRERVTEEDRGCLWPEGNPVSDQQYRKPTIPASRTRDDRRISWTEGVANNRSVSQCLILASPSACNCDSASHPRKKFTIPTLHLSVASVGPLGKAILDLAAVRPFSKVVLDLVAVHLSKAVRVNKPTLNLMPLHPFGDAILDPAAVLRPHDLGSSGGERKQETSGGHEHNAAVPKFRGRKNGEDNMVGAPHHLKDFMRQAGEVLFADVLLLLKVLRTVWMSRLESSLQKPKCEHLGHALVSRAVSWQSMEAGGVLAASPAPPSHIDHHHSHFPQQPQSCMAKRISARSGSKRPRFASCYAPKFFGIITIAMLASAPRGRAREPRPLSLQTATACRAREIYRPFAPGWVRPQG